MLEMLICDLSTVNKVMHVCVSRLGVESSQYFESTCLGFYRLRKRGYFDSKLKLEAAAILYQVL